jgi:DNA recombination protein RmuC
MADVIYLLLGALVGAVIATLWLRGRGVAEVAELKERAKNFEQRANELKAERDGLAARVAQVATLETTLQKEREAAVEKLSLINDAEKKLREAFDSLSAKALNANNQQFLTLAKATLEKFQESARGDLDKRQQAIDQMVAPVKETLGKFDTKLGELEKARVGAYEALRTQVQGLADSQTALKSETGNLVKALRAPQVRGRWGEIQLRRVVEFAGMLDHCDFFEQQSVTTDDGRLRPDMIVKLPGGKNVVVDAKAPLSAYLEALEAPDEVTRVEKLKAHARQIRDHLRKLGQKSYWEDFQPAPEFVVLFLPGEMFYSAALEQDPGLIEEGAGQRVILATPTTLIALLKAVSFGWRQEALAVNAAEISELGRELHERLGTLGGHFARLGERLDKAVEAYNAATSSLETRVLVTARKFTALGSGSETEIVVPEPIQKQPRMLQAPEMLGKNLE